jgi:hypothetical protein
MQLAKRHNTVRNSGVIGDTSNFNIAVNAKMFRVLSDTMYQDKVGSIVREISCNAADAHIEAGTPDLPFVIHVPNSIEPWFAVKDMGVGLSDEHIREIYSTYGESTKDQTNEMTGAFGLGSKTPFAYTDQFTLTSIHDGVKRVYVAVINDDGLPVINLLSEEPTTEHVGVEVLLPVDRGDYHEFEEAITTQLQFFRVKPNLENNMTNIAFKDLENNKDIAFQNDDVTMFNGRWNNSGIRDLYIVQGGVGYPVDVSKLNGITSEVHSFAQALDGEGAFIEVPIGTISVTANREGISYEPNTIKGIIDTLQRISLTMAQEAIAEIKVAKSLWERCCIFNKQIKIIRDALNTAIGTDTLFDGAKASRSNNMALVQEKVHQLGMKGVVLKKYEFRRRGYYSSGDGDWKVARVETGGIDVSTATHNYSTEEKTHLYPDANYIVIVKDTANKPVARIKKFMEDNDFCEILLIEGLGRGLVDVNKLTVANAFGIPVKQLTMLTDYEAPRKVAGVSADRRPRAYQFDESERDMHNSKAWRPVMDEINDVGEGIWIRMDRHNVQVDSDVRQVMELVNFGKITVPLIAVNNQTAQRIEAGKIGDDLMTPAEALAPIRAEVETVAVEYKQVSRLKSLIAGVESADVWGWLIRDRIAKQVQVPMIETIKDIKAGVEIVEKSLQRVNLPLGSIIDISDELSAGRTRAGKLTAKLDKMFPMLQHVSTYNTHKRTEKQVADYIKLVLGG